jgi:hypothetical protein
MPSRGVTSIKDSLGRRQIDEKTVRQSMAALEKRLAADFAERTRLRKQFAKPIKGIRAPMLAAKDSAASAAAAQMRQLHKVALARKLNRMERVKVTPGLFPGYFGATLAPPYNYEWTWTAADGNPYVDSVTADRNSGALSIDLGTNLDDSSNVAGDAAVGIYLYPPTFGTLQIWSAPSFNYFWGTVCDLDSAHADAWIGLFVGSYDLAGRWTGAVVDQQITLWSDDSFVYGSRSNPGSNSGYGLFASIPVDRQHQYIIWVWCGGDVSADGFHILWGSGASDMLDVSVPSISWQLSPIYVVEGARG